MQFAKARFAISPFIQGLGQGLGRSFVRLVTVALALTGLGSGCSLGSGPLLSAGLTSQPVQTITVPGPNVLAVTVNGDGSSCGFASAATLNMPCVSVTICAPGTSNCQTIPNILLDTGSWGLRIFRYSSGKTPLITVPLVPAGTPTSPLSECVTYLSSESQWGPVMTADVQLGGEPVISSLPIHVLDASSPGSENCSTVDPSTGESVSASASAAEAGFNGVLGIGLKTTDCGENCVGPFLDPNSDPMYYTCSGSQCAPAAVPLDQQVTNPVSALANDNNGVILELPGVPAEGAEEVIGALVFGIGTESNNQPSGITAYPTTPNDTQFGGHFQTVFANFGATAMDGFLDSGSSLISFPSATSGASAVKGCGPSDAYYADLYCPDAPTTFTATNLGGDGTTGETSFTIMSALALIDTGNIVFSDMAANSFPVNTSTFEAEARQPYVDWGMPYFLGRSITIGFENTQSSLGTGPYWAFSN